MEVLDRIGGGIAPGRSLLSQFVEDLARLLVGHRVELLALTSGEGA